MFRLINNHNSADRKTDNKHNKKLLMSICWISLPDRKNARYNDQEIMFTLAAVKIILLRFILLIFAINLVIGMDHLQNFLNQNMWLQERDLKFRPPS
jgi:hypothetical protein